jgi:hypothetical protein
LKKARLGLGRALLAFVLISVIIRTYCFASIIPDSCL